jgi:hypothetical protein
MPIQVFAARGAATLWFSAPLQDEAFVRCGGMAASVTLIQALWRDLKPSEDRVQLIRKCIRALDPDIRGPLVKPFACVQSAMHDVKAVAVDARLPGAPEKRQAEEAKGTGAKKAKA